MFWNLHYWVTGPVPVKSETCDTVFGKEAAGVGKWAVIYDRTLTHVPNPSTLKGLQHQSPFSADKTKFITMGLGWTDATRNCG